MSWKNNGQLTTRKRKELIMIRIPNIGNGTDFFSVGTSLWPRISTLKTHQRGSSRS